jgi:hypothetical protein
MIPEYFRPFLGQPLLDILDGKHVPIDLPGEDDTVDFSLLMLNTLVEILSMHQGELSIRLEGTQIIAFMTDAPCES